MIKRRRDGMVLISFEDWVPLQICLLARLAGLPTRPDTIRPDNVAVALDELGSRPDGELVLGLVADHIGDIAYCPTADELVNIGERLKQCHDEFERVQLAYLHRPRFKRGE